MQVSWLHRSSLNTVHRFFKNGTQADCDKKTLHSSFLQRGRMHKHKHQNVHAPSSLQQLPDPVAEQCLPIVSWFSHRPWAQKKLYPDRDLRENKELLKPGILLQTALYKTLKQIRLCTDGSTAPIVNCGTRAWDDNHLLFIEDCVFCEDPSIPQGAK